jgi:hypothetical protein
VCSTDNSSLANSPSRASAKPTGNSPSTVRRDALAERALPTNDDHQMSNFFQSSIGRPRPNPESPGRKRHSRVHSAKLAFESLENRALLAAGGVTVITHGAQFAGTMIPDWVVTMGQAILDRADGASTARSTGSMYQHDPATGGWTPVAASVWNNSNNPDQDVVLLYNWTDESDQLQNGWLEAAADYLFASLLDENDNLPGGMHDARFIDLALAAGGGGGLLDLHLIGHSRGGVLNSYVAERFDAAFEDLVIDQVTSLDAHPASLMGDRGYNSSNPGDSRLFTFGNVRFADNYFQSDGNYEPIFTFDFDGVVANGAYNFQIPTSVLENGGASLEHSDVHSWYYGTITAPFAAGYAGFSGAGRNHDGDASFPEAWWGNSGVPARTDTGFAYSDIGGASRAGLTVTSSKIDHGLVPSMFNGDFSLAGAFSDLLPGWERHGGGGTAARAGSEAYLQLTSGAAFRLHNAIHIDRHAVAVEYDYWTSDNDSTPDDLLEVMVDGQTIDAIPLATLTTGFVLDRRASFTTQPDLAAAIEFRIRDVAGDGIESAVRIDNLSLAIEVPAADADFNSDGFTDGADFLTWQRHAGTYLHANYEQGDADRDGNILADDLQTWRSNYGAATTASAGVSSALAIDPALISLAALDRSSLFSAGDFTASVAPLSSNSPFLNSSNSIRRRSSGVDSALSTGMSATGSPFWSVQRTGTSSFLAPSETYSWTVDVGSGSAPARTLRNRTAATSFSAMNPSASIDTIVSMLPLW